MLHSVAEKLDALGLRSIVAKAASLAYCNQTFSVDPDGHWVNQQTECTIVSPTLHTSAYSAIRARVMDQWCYAYAPKAGDIIIDCGAGVGEEAVVLAPLVGKVLSIEASPETFRCLTKTIERSKLANAIPIHCAVADKSGTALIDSGPSHIASSIMRSGKIAVPQRTIAELATNLPRIDLLRMNIEGAEKLAVLGVPWEKVRAAVISCHDFAGLPAKAQVLSALQSNGFEVITRNDRPDQPWVADYLYAGRSG